MKFLLRLHFFVGICFAGAIVNAQQNPYGAYSLSPQGSTRILGMGGGFAAISDDASGIFANPPGLAMSRWRWDFASGSNQILNKEADITGDGERDGLPYLYQFSALSARFSNWAFAVGTATPYMMNLRI